MQVALEPAGSGVAGYFEGDFFLAATPQDEDQKKWSINEMFVKRAHILLLFLVPPFQFWSPGMVDAPYHGQKNKLKKAANLFFGMIAFFHYFIVILWKIFFKTVRTYGMTEL